MSGIQPTFFLSHGGGPWPWLRKEMPFLEGLHSSLLAVAKNLPQRPRAIVVVSGHWEEAEFTVMASPKPPMIYDYSGFPVHTYQIVYPAPGLPSLAERMRDLLGERGIAARLDQDRGFDHGVYSILYPMFPDADIPVIQLSLRVDFDPASHFAVGEALARLRRENVLILGSGNLFHNMRAMNTSEKESREFDAWMCNALLERDLVRRNSTIMEWERAPFARHCQPREDHLAPLFVAMGAACMEQAEVVFREPLMGRVSVSSFRFG